MRFRASPFRLFSYIFFLLLIIPLAAQLALGQSLPSLAQSSPPVRHAPPPQPSPAPAHQEQFISYWTTETGWASELQLQNNQADHDLTVTPVLRSADGAETSLPAVTIKPLAAAIVDLGAATLAAAPQLVGTYGSIVLRYNSPSQLNLHADLMIRGIGHPFAFHIDAMGELPPDQAASREGIWWLPKDTTSDYLILTNQGSNPLPLVLTLYDAVGKKVSQSLTLPPRATGRYSVRQLLRSAGLTGSYGGIKVSPAVNAGSLDALHVLFDEEAAFSALLKMFDHDPQATLAERDYAKTAQWTLRAPMLALTHPDPVLKLPAGTVLQPQLFVRNTTAKPVDAALRFHWRSISAAGSAPGPRMRLNPYETRRIDVAALQDAKTLPSEAQWASVILTTNSLPDEVMAVAASYDAAMRYGAQTPFSDQLASHIGRAAYGSTMLSTILSSPWETVALSQP